MTSLESGSSQYLWYLLIVAKMVKCSDVCLRKNVVKMVICLPQSAICNNKIIVIKHVTS